MKETPECCKNCAKWEKFKEDCWVFWEGKKQCTQHIKSWYEEVLF